MVKILNHMNVDSFNLTQDGFGMRGSIPEPTPTALEEEMDAFENMAVHFGQSFSMGDEDGEE